jgi:hypothetical protein
MKISVFSLTIKKLLVPIKSWLGGRKFWVAFEKAFYVKNQNTKKW